MKLFLPLLLSLTVLQGQVSTLVSDIDGHYGIIGISVNKDNKVTAVYPRSPAEREGIYKKDIILDADDYEGNKTISGESYTNVILTIKRKICTITGDPAENCRNKWAHEKWNEKDGIVKIIVKREPVSVVLFGEKFFDSWQ